jgi:hypothetical protein
VWKRRCGRRPQPCTIAASRAAKIGEVFDYGMVPRRLVSP